MAYGIPEAEMFPWGYVVWIKEVPPDAPELEGTHGLWDVDTRTIYLDKTHPIAEKRGCYIHEYDHAYNDWKLWAHQNMNIKLPEAHEGPEEPSEEEETVRP